MIDTDKVTKRRAERLRFWDNEFLLKIREVLEAMRTLLKTPTPSPFPSTEGD